MWCSVRIKRKALSCSESLRKRLRSNSRPNLTIVKKKIEQKKELLTIKTLKI